MRRSRGLGDVYKRQGDIAGERLRVWAAHAIPAHSGAAPGTVLAATRDGIDIACADGALRLTAIQRAGGRRISAADYLNARPELKQATS